MAVPSHAQFMDSSVFVSESAFKVKPKTKSTSGWVAFDGAITWDEAVSILF